MTSPSEQETTATEIMVVNDSPGEECRIAILQDNHLEELYTERTATATNVGNIYKGRVTNVESAIQAAFIDYGEGQAGFLHISDLHPRYFPGATQTERVGKKIPRRSRPPIQNALNRGPAVLVPAPQEAPVAPGQPPRKPSCGPRPPAPAREPPPAPPAVTSATVHHRTQPSLLRPV